MTTEGLADLVDRLDSPCNCEPRTRLISGKYVQVKQRRSRECRGPVIRWWRA